MTFGLGFFEILLILILAVIFIPPKDLPGIIRKCAQILGKINKNIREFMKEWKE